MMTSSAESDLGGLHPLLVGWKLVTAPKHSRTGPTGEVEVVAWWCQVYSPDGVLRALTTGPDGLLHHQACAEAITQALGHDIASVYLDRVAALYVADEFPTHMVDPCPPPAPPEPS